MLRINYKGWSFKLGNSKKMYEGRQDGNIYEVLKNGDYKKIMKVDNKREVIRHAVMDAYEWSL